MASLRPTMDQVRRKELATTFRWYVKIDPPSGLGIKVPDEINFLCESAELPAMTHQSVEVNMRGYKIKCPGIWTPSDDITLELYETVSNDVSNFLAAWRGAHWDLDTLSSKGTSVKTEATLGRFNNKDIEIYQYNLHGVMLSGYTLPRLDASSDAWKPTITLTYDWFEEKSLV